MSVPRPPLSTLLAALSSSAAAAELLVLTVLPHGGQQVSRRNAWAAMATDTARARARREAATAMQAAVDAASARSGPEVVTAQR
jgi:hypothetical protein